MSSIRLSGTSSGYYDLTVPAAAGTNSIDLSALPVKDSSGNLAITGQLGINTTGTGVSGQYGTGITVRRAVPEVHLQRDDGNGNGGILMDNASATKRLFVGTYNGSSETHIGTNGTQRLVVSTDGYVTTPNQPVFSLRHSSVAGVDCSTTPYRLFNNQINSTMVNTGSHFNTSNGYFTAPVNGKYHFGITIRFDSFSGAYAYVTIISSTGLYVARELTSQTGSYVTHTVVGVASLSTNDTVHFEIRNSGDSSINIDGDTNAYGYLIG